MTNEYNILIYSVFIFFCYSFIILNMALPLFHIVKPLSISLLLCFLPAKIGILLFIALWIVHFYHWGYWFYSEISGKCR